MGSESGLGLFTSRPFGAEEVIGQYTGKVLYVKEGISVTESDRLVAISAGIRGVVDVRAHIVAPSSFGYVQGSRRCFTTYAQDGGRPDSKVKVNAYLQEYLDNGECKIQLVATKAIRANAEIFINYGEKYYSGDGKRGEVPGRNDLRLIPAWAAFSGFKQFAPTIVHAWGKLPRARQ